MAAAAAGVDDLPQPRAERLRVVLDLVETGHARPAAISSRSPRPPAGSPTTRARSPVSGWPGGT